VSFMVSSPETGFCACCRSVLSHSALALTAV
jgi:hypothetical protein